MNLKQACSNLCRNILMGVLVVPCATLSHAAPSAPDMLEQVLPAVVTVGVYKGSKVVGTAYGFQGNASDVAYTKGLDLAGAMGSGSGFIVERNGKKYVVTNAHVIDNASDAKDAIGVFSINRTKYPVRVVGADSFYDIAVLEFTERRPGSELTTVEFSPKLPRIGEPVYAIGNPLGEFPYTVTQGIIGGKNRERGGLTGKYGYLQSSATTIWGNSGGPLVNSNGKVVGINTQIEIVQRKLGTFVQPQLNFALESTLAARLVDELIERGRVQRAFLGIVATKPADDDRTEELPRLAGVMPGGPAASLAEHLGYGIFSINGVEVRNVEEVLGELEKVRPGAKVTLVLEQNKERTTVTLAAGELTQRRHGDMARYFLRAFAGLDLLQQGNQVVLEPAAGCAVKQNPLPCRQMMEFAELNPKTDKYDELVGFHEELRLEDAGVILKLKDGNFTAWHVTNPASLGLIMRLSALSGIVSFSGKVGTEDSIVSMILLEDPSAEEKSMLRSVLY